MAGRVIEDMPFLHIFTQPYLSLSKPSIDSFNFNAVVARIFFLFLLFYLPFVLLSILLLFSSDFVIVTRDMSKD